MGLLLLLMLAAEAAFSLDRARNGSPNGKFAPDLAPFVAQAHQGAAHDETVKVIVQYRQVPQAEQEGRAQFLGAHLNQRLGVVKGIVDLYVHHFHIANDTLLVFVTGLILASMALLADLIVRSRADT